MPKAPHVLKSTFKHPHPFLLLSKASSQALVPVDKTRAPTVDRLVVVSTSGRHASALEQLYSVIEVTPREATTRRVRLGCSSQCDVVLNDASISRRHAYLSWTDHGAYLEDDDSSAGTAINGRLLEAAETTQLKAGDRLTLGTVDLIYLPPAEFHGMVRRLFEK